MTHTTEQLEAMLAALTDERNRLATAHKQLMQSLDAANARAAAAGSALERDRSFVADTVNAVHSEISGREWMLTGRGPYEWDDDRYRDEFGSALSAIRAPIEKLRAIARDWSNCPTDPVEIQKSRTDWKARADAAWDALRNIAELNKTARDENGHAWDNSDLIAQEIHFALRDKPAPAVLPLLPDMVDAATAAGVVVWWDNEAQEIKMAVTVREAARVLLTYLSETQDSVVWETTEDAMAVPMADPGDVIFSALRAIAGGGDE